MTVEFQIDIKDIAVVFSLVEGGNSITFGKWLDKAGKCFNCVSYLNSLIENEEATLVEDTVLVPHLEIAKLSNSMALSLGLPPTLSWVMILQNNGTLDRPDFSLSVSWRDKSQTIANIKIMGSIISKGSQDYRIPEPLFSLLEAINKFNTTDTTDQNVRFEMWAKIQEKLPQVIDNGSLQAGEFIKTIRIVHASSFSLDIKSGHDGFSFDPILFDLDYYAAENMLEAKPLLVPAQQDLFAKNKFKSFNSVQKKYSFGRGSFVILDDNLMKALEVVKKVQSADRDTRQEFAKNPTKFLKEALSQIEDTSSIESLFVETSEYSERVLEIGIWEKKIVPWVKTKPGTWLPERFGFKIENKFIEIDSEDVKAFQIAVATAINEGKPEVMWKGEVYPANPKMEDIAQTLVGFAKPNPDPIDPEQQGKLEKEDSVNGQVVLVIADNFEEVKAGMQYVPRTQFSRNKTPNVLESILKPHQEEGLEWLQSAWKFGQSGVLLADDMGLGKTLLSLTFLAWLRQGMEEGKIRKAPILIVAPTGLLKNWEEEVDIHFLSPGLGNICRVYGTYLQNLRIERGNEINLGSSNLEKDKIQEADWVLTTYETLRDYQHSFGSIRFACGVFDEMQKIKTPGTVVTEASKAMNIDFKIGVTGTPIENRLSDLWCLVDTLEPGLLGDLKSFSQKYEKDASEKDLRDLKDSLSQPQEQKVATMLRRMKDKDLLGLPEKNEYKKHSIMPEVQANKYNEAVMAGKSIAGRAGAMLETLHQLKSSSLHPVHPDQAEGLSYIDYSARFIELFKILDEVEGNNERALVFVESLEMHKLLPDLIKQKYNLPERPMTINGTVSGQKRQKRINLFRENNSSFDVMILSPKAGGVGLTLTSANHVIHLSRWWNPAVEDQCTDRIYRIGQKLPVHVYYLLAEHPSYGDQSFDCNLDALLERKRSLSKEMLMPPENEASDSATLFSKSIGDDDGVKPNTQSDNEIQCMNPIEFEDYILDLFKSYGYQVERTPKSWDYGADGIATYIATGEETIIQAKHTQGKGLCSEDAVYELLKARDAYQKPSATLMVVSNAHDFSNKAKEVAKEHGVVLKNSKDLFL